MRRILVSFLLLFLMSPLAFAELIIPDAPENYVLDQADVLSEETERLLNYQLSNFELEKSTQVVVVTLDSLQNYPIEEVSLEIGREWGVGQEEFDNGIVFLIAPNERESRIEVGRGLEGIMPDTSAWLILDEVAIPYFKVDNFDTGAIEGTFYILNVVGNENFDISVLEPAYDEDLMAFIASFGLIFFWTILSFMSQSKSWWAGGLFGALIGGVLFQTWIPLLIGGAIGLFMDYIASTYLYKKIKSSGSSGFWGGSGGSSSGGGFSGGGGSFGGGGASGSW